MSKLLLNVINALRGRIQALEDGGGSATTLAGTYNNSLPTAISSIGATETVLLVNEDTTVSTAVTVPATLRLRFTNGAVINKSGSGAIQFQGLGIDDPLSPVAIFAGFANGDITWTGTNWPKNVSSEIFDTGNNSETDRLQRLTAAFVGKTVMFHVHPRVVTSFFVGNDGHSIYLLAGVHLNTYAETTEPTALGEFPFTMGSNSVFTSQKGAILETSTVPTMNRLVTTKPNAENCIIYGNHFRGRPDDLNDGVDATTAIDNGFNCHIRDNIFEDCDAYCALIFNSTSGGGVTSYCSIRRNYISGTASQVLGILDGEFCDISDNDVNLRDLTYLSSFVPIDLEPNKWQDRIKDCRIERNRVDIRGMVNAGNCRFLMVQAINTRQVERVFIRDNQFIANDIRGTQIDDATQAIDIVGTEGFEITGNTVQGLNGLGNGIAATLCRRGKITNNQFINGNADIELIGCEDVEVKDNRAILTTSFDNTGEQSARLIEDTVQDFPVDTISGSSLTFRYNSYGNQRGQIYGINIGMNVELNGQTYRIVSVDGDLSITDTLGLTLDRAISAAPTSRRTVAPANVNTETDEITSVAHGFLTGGAVHYIPLGTAIGNLTTFTTFYAIRISADVFKLADTYEAALAGTARNLTSQGVGNHEFYPTVLAISYGNKFDSNEGYKDVEFGRNTTSLDLTPSRPVNATINGTVKSNDYKRGTTFETTGSTQMSTVTLTDNNGGKEYSVYNTNTNGLKLWAADGYIRDGATLSPQFGQYISQTAGSFATVKKIGNEYVVIAKNGTWTIPTTVGATLINAIDCGRTSGGTVAGWEQDALFTGGDGGSFTAYTPDTSRVILPATSAAYQTFRQAISGDFEYNWTGRDNTKSHLVRVHICNGDIGGTPGNTHNITINSLRVESTYDPIDDVGAGVVRILEYLVPSGTTTIEVVLGSIGGSSPFINAIELYQMP